MEQIIEQLELINLGIRLLGLDIALLNVALVLALVNLSRKKW